MFHTFVCTPDDGQTVGYRVDDQLVSVHGPIYAQVCETNGLPPVQLEGKEKITDLVWVPEEEQADQLEYEKEVQVLA